MQYQTTIVTYGGGEVLDKVFNGIAMLTGHDSIIPLICGLFVTLSLTWGICKAYLGDFEGIHFRKYLFPMAATALFCFAPKTTVHIEDIFQNKIYTVSNIPILLGKTAEMISSCGYAVTRAFESVMHTAGDGYYRFTPEKKGNRNSYASTGMIFGAESVLDLNRYRITNGDLEQNMKRFAKQCVMYDLAHGKYSFKELKNSGDLWNFLKNNTSNLRMIKYKPLKRNENKDQYLTCKEALITLDNAFGKEKEQLSKNELLKHLPFAFKALTGISKNSEELISQQLMISYLSSNFSGAEYAKSRAMTQKNNTYLIVGSMASSSLITMRAILEALIYAAFIFVMPMALLPKGFHVLKSWFQLLVWIQLWTPFYAVINYIQQVSAHSYANSIFPSTSNATLTIATSIGLENLHQDMYALGGYLAMSIPFLSYAIVYGGAGSFTQMAGSLLTPVHSASTSASAEQSSGNYSLANTNFGQTHYNNSSMHQKQLAPSISSGFMTENRGAYSLMHTPGKSIYQETIPNMSTSINVDEMLSSHSSNQVQSAKSLVESNQKALSESYSRHERNMADFTEHFGKSENSSTGYSSREAFAFQKSANYVSNSVKTFSEQHGLTERQSAELFGNLSLPGKWGGGYSYQNGDIDDSTISEARNIVESKDFQEHTQTIRDFSKSEALNELDDHSKKVLNAYTQSVDEVESSSKQYSASLSNLESVTQTNSIIEQDSAGIRQNLNQEFFDYLGKNCGGTSRTISILQESGPELNNYAQKFIAEKYSELKNPVSMDSMDKKFDNISVETSSHNSPSINNLPGNEEFLETPHKIRSKEDIFSQEYMNKNSNANHLIGSQSTAINEEKEALSGNFRENDNKYLLRRSLESNISVASTALGPVVFPVIKPLQEYAKNAQSEPNPSFLQKTVNFFDSTSSYASLTSEKNASSEANTGAVNIASKNQPLWRQK